MKTIKSKSEFERVFTKGRRASFPLLKVRALKHQGDPGRVAFVAPKRLGKAVVRNRCKRVLRQAALECGLPREGCLAILLATPQTYDAKPTEVADELRRALIRVGVDVG